MKYRELRVALRRVVNLGNYESATFGMELAVDLSDESNGGLDPSKDDQTARYEQVVRTAFQDVARLLVEERKRRLKSPDDAVDVEEKHAGRPIVDVPPPGRS